MECIPSRSTKKFFPHPSYDSGKDSTQEFVDLGYFPVWLSIFDHWLSAEEAETPLMFYRLAREHGMLKEYMVGEKKFLSFYHALAKDGVYIAQGGKVFQADADDPDFRKVVRTSLREKKMGDFMDVYFIGPALRVLGGYDRTDRLLLRRRDGLPALYTMAEQHGLHLLRKEKYE